MKKGKQMKTHTEKLVIYPSKTVAGFFYNSIVGFKGTEYDAKEFARQQNFSGGIEIYDPQTRKLNERMTTKNTCLVATAPELLELCKLLFEALNSSGVLNRHSQPFGSRTTYWKLLRDTIAKAEGEEIIN